MSSKERVMISKYNNIDNMINGEADEVIKELFKSLLSSYQAGLERLVKGSDSIFDCVHLLYYKCHKINYKRGRSYIDSSE